jgi:DNA polymerase I-like protein with 3'-5' exonuclease and polymerase domains
MKYSIFDIEANGLHDATEIHCLSYAIYEGKKLIAKDSTTDKEKMKAFLKAQDILVGHNIISYDIPLLERLLEIEIEARLIDTLGLSWYLVPAKGYYHGLEAYGERFGVPKPKINPEEWAGPLPDETLEQFQSKMMNRCSEDVKINSKLFHFMMDYLVDIYGDFELANRAIRYNTFKMKCLREQETEGIVLDRELAIKSKFDLEFELEEKTDLLASSMPKQLEKECPKKMYKKDGALSALGMKWQNMLVEKGLPLDTKAIYKKGNPGSHVQLKEWLFSLGWKPQTYKVSSATGEELPQVSLPFGGGLCPSIKELAEEHDVVKHLEGYYMVRHRIGLFKSFLENVDVTGRVYSRAQGFTNTYRLLHAKPIANLPGVDKYYGEQIRGCLKVTDDSYVMLGSDVSGLEDTTKMHYMYNYDPEYVKQMLTPGFDGHTNVAVNVGMMTKEEEDHFKAINKRKEEQGDDFKYLEGEDEEYKRLAKIRKSAKPINFGGQYGIGPAKLAENMGISLEEAEKLHTGYWKLNWSIKQTAKDAKIKVVNGQKWLYNPVSQLWLFLKDDKDKFSTLNQSTGVYVFDTWVRHIRILLKPYGIKIKLQYHDEVLFECKKELKDTCTALLKKAMEEANKQLQLNVTVRIDTQSGKNYAECH